MKTNDTVIRFTGIGGQGILFAGKMLAEAALSAGIHPCFAPSYGAESAGLPNDGHPLRYYQPLLRSHAAVVMNGASPGRTTPGRGGIIAANSSVCVSETFPGGPRSSHPRQRTGGETWQRPGGQCCHRRPGRVVGRPVVQQPSTVEGLRPGRQGATSR